jgi:integrase
MPALKRYATDYPGVYYIVGTSARGKRERIYYIRYWKNGKQVDEKAGRQFKDDMTPARAATLRGKRIEGEMTNAERRAQIEAEKTAQDQRWTIQRLWDSYSANRERTKGLRTDAGRYEKYLKSYFGGKEPREIVLLDIDRLKRKTLGHLSPQSVKHIVHLLKRIINYGVKRNFCPPLPFPIETPRVNNLKTEDLTGDQLQALLKAIDEETNIQVKNLILLVLYTGIRRGEAFKLRWEDVDFERGFITLKDPKGGTDQHIPLNDPARAILMSHPKESDFVFPGRGGRERKDMHKRTRAIADKAGLPKTFRPLHGLRHYFASSLASSGKVDMYTLQRLLTHKDPRMTQRYAHLRDETLKRASDLIGDIVGEITNNRKAQSER